MVNLILNPLLYIFHLGCFLLGTPTNSTLANVVAAAGVTSSPLGPLITGPANNNASSTQGGAGSSGATGGAAANVGNSQFLLSRVGLDLSADDEIMTQVG